MANASRSAHPHGDCDLSESALRQAYRELRQLVDFLPQHVIVLDAQGTLLQANQMLLEFYGRTLEEMQGAGTTERVKRDVHPDDLERVRSERQDGFTKRAPFEIEKRLLGKDGRYRWFLFRYKPMLHEEGAVLHWYATATDIEDRKRTESLLAAEMRTLQMIADGASLTDILNHVCTSIDVQISPSVTTILLMDSAGKWLWPTAGPRVPDAWTRAITPRTVITPTFGAPDFSRRCSRRGQERVCRPGTKSNRSRTGRVRWPRFRSPRRRRTHALSDRADLCKLDPAVAPVTTGLGVLGMPGFTAYGGLSVIGKPAPGETVVVAAAIGPVGSLVGQLAKLAGARAVGIAGGPEGRNFGKLVVRLSGGSKQ
jgi:PAS domain S-box-containing protein